jgi:hypothetical protein
MGAILNFNNWKRLNEQATQSPTTLNNAISALKPNDARGMWAIVKEYEGLENILDILFNSGQDRTKLADKIREKFGNAHFGLGGDGSMPKVSALLDEFQEATNWEIWKSRFIPNDDTYKGGEGKDPEFFKKDSWKMTSGGAGGGETSDPSLGKFIKDKM